MKRLIILLSVVILLAPAFHNSIAQDFDCGKEEYIISPDPSEYNQRTDEEALGIQLLGEEYSPFVIEEVPRLQGEIIPNQSGSTVRFCTETSCGNIVVSLSGVLHQSYVTCSNNISYYNVPAGTHTYVAFCTIGEEYGWWGTTFDVDGSSTYLIYLCPTEPAAPCCLTGCGSGGTYKCSYCLTPPTTTTSSIPLITTSTTTTANNCPPDAPILCPSGGCCPTDSICCGNLCCPTDSICCDNGGCCSSDYPFCCGNGCCPTDYPNCVEIDGEYKCLPDEANTTTTAVPGVTTTTTTFPTPIPTSSTSSPTTTTSTTQAENYSISGSITGDIVADVTINLSGADSQSVVTSDFGYYRFSDLESGYYTITPEHEDCEFEPPNHVIQSLTGDLSNMDFISTEIKTTLCPASSIYGSNSKETALLRSIRDNILNKTHEGRELIKLYYQWSPAIVRAMEGDEEFKEDVKDLVDGFLGMME